MCQLQYLLLRIGQLTSMLFNRRAHHLVALLDDKHLEVVREKTLKIGVVRAGTRLHINRKRCRYQPEAGSLMA